MRSTSKIKSHRLWFPVDISTGSRGTIGGMAGNNSCGSRSIRYGNMVHNVRAIDAMLADGTTAQFGEVPEDLEWVRWRSRAIAISSRARARIVDGVTHECRASAGRSLLRRVGGYNIDMIRRI